MKVKVTEKSRWTVIEKISRGSKLSSRGNGIGEAVASLGAGGKCGSQLPERTQAAERVAESIRSCGSRALVHRADVYSEEQVREMLEQMFAAFGT